MEQPAAHKSRKPAGAAKKKATGLPALSNVVAAAAAALNGEGRQEAQPGIAKKRHGGAAMLFQQEEFETIAQERPVRRPSSAGTSSAEEPAEHKDRQPARESAPRPQQPTSSTTMPAQPKSMDAERQAIGSAAQQTGDSTTGPVARTNNNQQPATPAPQAAGEPTGQQANAPASHQINARNRAAAVAEAAHHRAHERPHQPQPAPADQHERVWEQCLSLIQDYVEERAFKVWFKPIRAVALDGQVLTLQVPSQFFYEWLEEHYVELLGKTIKRMLGKGGRLEYRIVMDSRGQSQQPTTMQVPGTTQAPPPTTEGNRVELPPHVKDPFAIVNPYSIPGLKRVQIDSQLNPKLTFERFVEGDCNRLARGAAMHVAEKPGSSAFNPLVLFGNTGWGKTHLAHAIGNEVRRLHPNKTVLYVSTEKFITQYIEHARTNAVNDFVHFYQLIDVLIVDDIHYFAPAQRTQDAFFNIFNHLHQNGKQIVLTCDTAPKDLNGLQDRLLSRFKWGLNADIQQPGYETRAEILRMKMSNEGVEFPAEVVDYVAQHVTNNVRELESAVIGLLAQSMINNREVDLTIAKHMIRNLVKVAAEEVTIQGIMRMVCGFYNVTEEQILTKGRRREFVQPRQTVMFLGRKFTKDSLKGIGKIMGGYDHTTVLHACKQVENLIATDPQYRAEVEDLTQRIQVNAG